MLRKISLWGLIVAVTTVPMLAQGGYFRVSQADVRVDIEPLVGTVSAEDYYAYDPGFGVYSSRNPLAEAETAVLFLYRDPTDQGIYLFFIHNRYDTGPAGSAEYRFTGLPGQADFVVRDDPTAPDVYDIPGGRVYWEWQANRTDGGVLGPLGTDFKIELTPVAFTGINRIVFLYGNIANPSRRQLNLTNTITIEASPVERPRARFEVRPTDPKVQTEVTFDATGTTADPTARIERYFWDFTGDGRIDRETTEPVTRFTYTEGGTYNATLRVRDSMGFDDTYQFTVDVSPVTITATRSISTTHATPGSTFRVEVRIRTEQDLAGVGLEERIPVNWELTPVENAGAVFRRPSVQWVFMEPIRAGTERRIVYDLTVPKAEQLVAVRMPDRFCISGIFQSKTPAMEFEVDGEACVIVTDCLPILTAVAHLIPASAPGERDRIDLRLDESITMTQLNRAGELWRTDQSVVGTCGERITLSKLKEIAAYAESCTPVDQPLPQLEDPGLHAVRTIRYPIPCENVVMGFYDLDGRPLGNKFTVKVEIWVDRDAIGVGLDEELPIGWRVTPLQNDGFIYKPSTNQWAYLGTLKAGSRHMRQIIYEVEVPPTTVVQPKPPHTCEVLDTRTIVGRADTGLPCVEVDVTGMSRVELTDCLNVITAISRWDVERDQIDLLLSDRISFRQVQRAIAFWLEGEKVPRTCFPHIVDYETMKEIVARWLTDAPICDPLPGAPPDVCEGR